MTELKKIQSPVGELVEIEPGKYTQDKKSLNEYMASKHGISDFTTVAAAVGDARAKWAVDAGQFLLDAQNKTLDHVEPTAGGRGDGKMYLEACPKQTRLQPEVVGDKDNHNMIPVTTYGVLRFKLTDTAVQKALKDNPEVLKLQQKIAEQLKQQED